MYKCVLHQKVGKKQRICAVGMLDAKLKPEYHAKWRHPHQRHHNNHLQFSTRVSPLASIIHTQQNATPHHASSCTQPPDQ